MKPCTKRRRTWEREAGSGAGRKRLIELQQTVMSPCLLQCPWIGVFWRSAQDEKKAVPRSKRTMTLDSWRSDMQPRQPITECGGRGPRADGWILAPPTGVKLPRTVPPFELGDVLQELAESCEIRQTQRAVQCNCNCGNEIPACDLASFECK